MWWWWWWFGASERVDETSRERRICCCMKAVDSGLTHEQSRIFLSLSPLHSFLIKEGSQVQSRSETCPNHPCWNCQSVFFRYSQCWSFSHRLQPESGRLEYIPPSTPSWSCFLKHRQPPGSSSQSVLIPRSRDIDRQLNQRLLLLHHHLILANPRSFITLCYYFTTIARRALSPDLQNSSSSCAKHPDLTPSKVFHSSYPIAPASSTRSSHHLRSLSSGRSRGIQRIKRCSNSNLLLQSRRRQTHLRSSASTIGTHPKSVNKSAAAPSGKQHSSPSSEQSSSSLAFTEESKVASVVTLGSSNSPSAQNLRRRDPPVANQSQEPFPHLESSFGAGKECVDHLPSFSHSYPLHNRSVHSPRRHIGTSTSGSNFYSSQEAAFDNSSSHLSNHNLGSSCHQQLLPHHILTPSSSGSNSSLHSFVIYQPIGQIVCSNSHQGTNVSSQYYTGFWLMGQKASVGLKRVGSSDGSSGNNGMTPGQSALHRLGRGGHGANSSSAGNNNNNKDVGPDLARPARLDLLLDMPPAPLDVMAKHGWSPDDRSLNIFVKTDDPLTFHRHPVAQSTDCVRGKVGYTRGLHVWEITWSTRQRGTHAVIGVATAEAPLHATGYSSLIGANAESWGWDLGRNKLFHDSKNQTGTTYPSNLGPDENFIVPDSFLVVLDMDEGTLSFVVDGQYLGVAFRGMKGKKLYPIVSAVWGHCEITMRYLGGLDRKYHFLTAPLYLWLRSRRWLTPLTLWHVSYIMQSSIPLVLAYSSWSLLTLIFLLLSSFILVSWNLRNLRHRLDALIRGWIALILLIIKWLPWLESPPLQIIWYLFLLILWWYDAGCFIISVHDC